jgi:hypothetical protein
MNAVVLIVLGLLLKAFPALSADDVITKVEKSASRKNSAGAQVSVDIDPFRPATQSKLKAISGSYYRRMSRLPTLSGRKVLSV